MDYKMATRKQFKALAESFSEKGVEVKLVSENCAYLTFDNQSLFQHSKTFLKDRQLDYGVIVDEIDEMTLRLEL